VVSIYLDSLYYVIWFMYVREIVRLDECGGGMCHLSCVY